MKDLCSLMTNALRDFKLRMTNALSRPMKDLCFETCKDGYLKLRMTNAFSSNDFFFLIVFLLLCDLCLTCFFSFLVR
jgi:hypothetical protein